MYQDHLTPVLANVKATLTALDIVEPSDRLGVPQGFRFSGDLKLPVTRGTRSAVVSSVKGLRSRHRVSADHPAA